MSSSPDHDLLKLVANRLAATITMGAHGGALRLLGTFLGEPPPDGPRVTASAGTATHEQACRRVGIWEERSDGGRSYFSRRSQDGAEWFRWANLGRIDPKGSRPRILLLGESVARGWFYEPVFTPASVLQRTLESQASQAVEVIDLARTDLGLEIESLAISALALRPDMAVVFAGNNWRPSLPQDPRELGCVAASLRHGGVAELKSHTERLLRGTSSGVTDRVCAAYRADNVPIVWVVPESNLADWHDQRGCVPPLPSGRMPEWLRTHAAAQEALRQQDVGRAAELARRMIELDQGTSATGLAVLAQYMACTGELELARRYFESARDAEIWNWTGFRCPRPYAITQDVLRSAKDHPRVSVVDLPAIFKEFSKGELPGRQLFLDYCHLTATGIRVAMAAVAASVQQLLWARTASWHELLSRTPSPPTAADAEARLSAAVHNAHWWQPESIVTHHCAEALKASEHVAPIMSVLADLQCYSVPPLVTPTAAWIAVNCSRTVQFYVLRASSHRYDDTLVNSIRAALYAAGKPLSSEVALRRIERHKATRSAQNLLDFYFLSSTEQQAELDWILPFHHDQRFVQADFYQAFGTESRFVFIATAASPLNLRICWRLGSQHARRAMITILLNGHLVDGLAITGEWTVVELALPGPYILAGTNHLVIRWPSEDLDVERALAAAADELLEEAMRPLHVVFGQIHSVVVGEGDLSQHLAYTWRNPF